MFDDYVEHASSVPGTSPPNRHLPQIQYEGFESTPHEDGIDVEDSSLTAFDQPDYEPTFQLGSVQHTLPAPLVHLAVSSNILTMALKSNTLQQLSLKNDVDSDIHIANIGLAKKGDVTIYKIFTDPTGRHTIITTQQGENFYLYEGWQKARPLPKKKMVIESVAWNPNATSSSSGAYPRTSTREILLGDQHGCICEAVLDAHDDMFRTPDRHVQPIFTFPDRQPVTGLHAGSVPGTNQIVVLAASPSRFYEFSGAVDRRPDEVGKLYEPIFVPYREAAPKFLELPGNTQHSELHVWQSSSGHRNTRTIAWLTAQGIYHGTMNLAPNSVDVIESASLLQYPYSAANQSPTSSPTAAPNPVPLSMAVTDFHFLLLYHDRVCAVSRLNDRLVYEEFLGLRPTERPIAIAADPREKTYWIYTNASLLEVRIAQEDRDVWQIHLNCGNHDLALQFAKTPAQRALINGSLADEHFKAGRFIQAAQCYAQSTRGFEDVALAFHDAKEPDALRYFLVCRLERTPKSLITQRMMLATWLVEFYLGKLNTLDDVVTSEGASLDVENLRTERDIVEDELRQFLQTYKANLHRPTVYELILSHGRTDVFLHYAAITGDFQRVIEHYVMNEEWGKAVDQLSRQSDLDLYYRFSSVLMRHAPKESVDSWLRQPSLDPLRLIPALLQRQRVPSSPLEPNHAIRYLQHLVFVTGNTSPIIHNLLITFLASTSPAKPSSSPASSSSKLPTSTALSSSGTPEPTAIVNAADLPLLRFLSTAPKDPITSRPYYDLDYALRLCKRHNRLQACVHIYAQMEMWEESVELALEMGELELAKINADRPEDEVLRKKLWLMVAKYVVQDKKDIRTAMRFLDNTNILKVEDILPFFPDFVVIDDFKDEICTALEGYSAHIESLKTEMNDATKTADIIKQDMADLKNRFVTLEPAETCSTCDLPLLTRQFYIFPCQHAFHADCLISQAKEYLSPTSLRRIIHLQDELMRLTNIPQPPKVQHSRQNSSSIPVVNGANASGQQARNLLSAGANLGRAVVVAPAVAGRNVIAAAGAGLRDLIVPESLATVITSNLNLNLSWGGSNDGKDIESVERAKERAEKLKVELDELLAAACPLCESLVAGLDKPFVLPGEVDHSWDL